MKVRYNLKKVLLSNTNDKQKSLLTSLAYLNIDFSDFQELKSSRNRITISDLELVLRSPHTPYLGSLFSTRLKRKITGVTTSNLELLQELINAGLGDLEVLDFNSDEKTGFNGICFKDSNGNIGFSFRGTDLKTFSSLKSDLLEDIRAFLTDNNHQVAQAQSLFNTYHSSTSQNFLYGHSLGGFIAEKILLQNHSRIANAFVINPLHIDSTSLTSPSEIEPFKSAQKFSCFVIGGDYVSSINKPNKFSDNIHYVKNNGNYINNIVSNHLIEAAEFDESGNFVTLLQQEAFNGYDFPPLEVASEFINEHPIKKFLKKIFFAPQTFILNAKLQLSKLFKRKKDSSAEHTEKPQLPTDWHKCNTPTVPCPEHTLDKKHRDESNTKKWYEDLQH